ncbi:MAG: glycosyltransferase family 2 protein [Rhizobiaceae bacterium]
MTNSTPKASVIVCAYSDDRWQQLCDAIDSLKGQDWPNREIIVVIDHNPGLLAGIAARYPDVRTMSNEGPRGLSGARNTGVRNAGGFIIAFLDDDASANPNWLSLMMAHYRDPSVIGFGGGVIPIWPDKRPRWLPEEFNWVVGCSYKGQPEEVASVRNPIGCNMSFRRAVFDSIGGFREGIGREGSDASGCEETEFCIRARQAFPQACILYDPGAQVHHNVSADRTRWAYFRKRCLAEGRSKTLVVGAVGAHDGLSSERAYVTRVLPAGVVTGLRTAMFSLDPWGLARAGGIFAGLGYTAFGYLNSRLRNAWR